MLGGIEYISLDTAHPEGAIRDLTRILTGLAERMRLDGARARQQQQLEMLVLLALLVLVVAALSADPGRSCGGLVRLTPGGTDQTCVIVNRCLGTSCHVQGWFDFCRGHGQAPRAIRPLQDVDVSEGQIRDTIINHSVEV